MNFIKRIWNAIPDEIEIRVSYRQMAAVHAVLVGAFVGLVVWLALRG